MAGHATEKLLFLVDHFWFNATTAEPPLSVKASFSIVEALNQEFVLGSLPESSKTQIRKFADLLNRAESAYVSNWMSGEHGLVNSFIRPSDIECIEPKWFAENRIFRQAEWSAVIDGLTELKTSLPDELSLCWDVGQLCARVAHLFGEFRVSSIPGEANPVPKLQQRLNELQELYECLGDLDMDLGIVHGVPSLSTAQRSAADLFPIILSRLGQTPNGVRCESSPSSAREYYTPPELAKKLGVSPEKVRQMIKAGKLRAVNTADHEKKRPRWRIPKESLERLVELDTPLSRETQRRRPRRRKSNDVTIEFFK